MIPAFNEDGYLPAGVHVASLEEIAERFGNEPEIRRVEMDSVRWLVDLAKRAGVKRLIVNGSLVTAVEEPNDVDCILLIEPVLPQQQQAEDEIREGLPFLEIQLVNQEEFDWLVSDFFATDRDGVPKGVVEVMI